MLIELSVGWLIAVNILGWLFIHMAVSFTGMCLPLRLFRTRIWLYRARAWERGGRIYERIFHIKAWKDRLPDGAAIFRGGFRKADLNTVSAEYLNRFAEETCRGEAVHWVTLFAAALFFIWNPWWAGLIMIAYAITANMPCILAQRYNRLRLMALLARVERRAGRSRQAAVRDR